MIFVDYLFPSCTCFLLLHLNPHQASQVSTQDQRNLVYRVQRPPVCKCVLGMRRIGRELLTCGEYPLLHPSICQPPPLHIWSICAAITLLGVGTLILKYQSTDFIHGRQEFERGNKIRTPDYI